MMGAGMDPSAPVEGPAPQLGTTTGQNVMDILGQILATVGPSLANIPMRRRNIRGKQALQVASAAAPLAGKLLSSPAETRRSLDARMAETQRKKNEENIRLTNQARMRRIDSLKEISRDERKMRNRIREEVGIHEGKKKVDAEYPKPRAGYQGGVPRFPIPPRFASKFGIPEDTPITTSEMLRMIDDQTGNGDGADEGKLTQKQRVELENEKIRFDTRLDALGKELQGLTRQQEYATTKRRGELDAEIADKKKQMDDLTEEWINKRVAIISAPGVSAPKEMSVADVVRQIVNAKSLDELGNIDIPDDFVGTVTPLLQNKAATFRAESK